MPLAVQTDNVFGVDFRSAFGGPTIFLLAGEITGKFSPRWLTTDICIDAI
jgi:hypothetical protein